MQNIDGLRQGSDVEPPAGFYDEPSTYGYLIKHLLNEGGHAYRRILRHRELLVFLLQREFLLTIRGLRQNSYRSNPWLILVGVAVLIPLISLPILASDVAIGRFIASLLIGLIFYLWMAQCLIKGPNIIREEFANIKKVAFQTEVLPVYLVASGALKALLCFTLVLLLALPEGVHCLWVPLLLVPFSLVMLGAVCVLSILGVFYKWLPLIMIGIVITSATSSSIFLDLGQLPETVQNILWLNPLTYPIETMRLLLIENIAPSLASYSLYLFSSILLMVLGVRLFQRSQGECFDAI